MRSRFIYVFSLITLILIAGGLDLFAQEKKLIQFSGVIQSTNTGAVVPYVTVRNLSYRTQTFASNHQGYFSFVAHEGDTISFTSVGYSSVQLVIPKGLPESKYTAMVKMTTEVVELEVVRPYPWASVDEFNMAFMDLEIADDDIVVARRNVSRESLAALAEVTPRDANEMRTFNTNQNHIDLSGQAINQRMANPLLSPFAWGNFIKQITEGNKSRTKNKW